MLTPGARIGAYEIVGSLGAGGMGEVYRARDTKLNRDVAVKILSAAFAGEPDRMARFRREAQVLASLNHSNIAHIYGVEETPAIQALVMELVEGPTLADRIAQGPVAIADALPIARQLADALEAAHEQGVVHRDLKPANIKVRPDGTVKVLDFGLAKAMETGSAGSAGSAGSIANSPTLTVHATQMGMILGTAAYMAPEQAKGAAVDRRADIWAFGVVLYEMLTGRGLFVADTMVETLAHVMTREVNLASLPADTPARVRKLIAQCLVRNPKQRLRDIGDARLLLDEPDESPSIATPVVARPANRLAVPVAIGLSLVAIVASVMAFVMRSPPEMPSVHLSIALPAGEQFTTAPAISPDGRTIVYGAGRTSETSRLYVRALDTFAARPVDASRNAQLPFFSPDGRFIAFFASGKLFRVPVTGGAPTAVTTVPKAWGGSWCTDNTIIYVRNFTAGLWRIPSSGGTPVQLTTPDGAVAGYAHAFPQCLPGSNDVLFSFWGQTFYSAVLEKKSGTWRQATELKNTSGAPAIGIYAENGHMLSGDSAGGVTAVAWKPSASAPPSAETAVLDSVYWVVGNERIWFNVSANGTAVYVRGNPLKRHLVWVDRKGEVTQLPGEADAISEATISRDGSRIVRRGKVSQWVENLATGTRTRIVSDLLTWQAGWLPGQERIVVSSNKDGDWDLYTVSANGNGGLTPLLKKPYAQHPLAVAPDGSVVFFESHPVTGTDIGILSPDGKTRPLVATTFTEGSAAVSSDGKYVAYVSDESGRNEVYAMPFSGTGDRVTISTDGGTGPVWSRDGRELFYRAGDDLMSAQIRSTSPLVLGERKKLLDVSGFEPAYFHDFDVSPDGQRFLFIRSEPEARPTRLDVIVNWFPELAKKVAAR